MLKSLIDDSKISRKLYFIAFLTILLITLLNFSNAIPGDFVADDIPYIVENELIKSFLNPDILFSKEHLTDKFVKFNNYRPIYFFTLSIEYALFGLDPLAYHLVNIFLHVINGFLLYILALKYTSKKLLALLTSIIFAIHPIHTEAVSNITGLSELLTAFFLLLATWSYSQSKRLDFYYLFSLICYLLGIMSKESGVILLGVIVLLDICSNWPNINKLQTRILYYAGYIFTLLIYLGFKFSLRGSIVNSKNIIFTGDLTERIYTMSLVFIKYFVLLIWPNKLITFYDTFLIPIVKEPTIPVIGALCLIIGLLILGISLLWYERFTAFAILFFFGTISVVSNIFFDVGVIMAERFLYFPSIGICLLIALGLHLLISKENSLRYLGIGLSILVFCVATVRTYIRNIDWLTQDSVREAFIRDAPKSPRIAIMQNDKVIELAKEDKIEEAIKLGKQIAKDYPNYATAQYKLGILLENSGQGEEALEYFFNAKELRPDNLEIRVSYAKSLLNNNRLLEAKTELEEIVKINSNSAESYNYLGIVYINLGLYSQAKRQFEKALSIDPNYKAAEINLFKLQEINKK